MRALPAAQTRPELRLRHQPVPPATPLGPCLEPWVLVARWCATAMLRSPAPMPARRSAATHLPSPREVVAAPRSSRVGGGRCPAGTTLGRRAWATALKVQAEAPGAR